MLAFDESESNWTSCDDEERQVADFNERKPSETRRDRVKALEEERRSILVKAIEKREKAAEDPVRDNEKVSLCSLVRDVRGYRP